MSYRKTVEEKVIDLPAEPKQTPRPQQVHHNKPTFDETKMTRQELRSILKAMDNEGFDHIMDEYIKEISNPDNVKETNQYLKEMQDKRDVPANVKLVQPKEGFCLKSKKTYKNLSQKVFINICSYDGVQKPFANQDNKQYWSIPFLLNKQRNDQDEKGNHVLVFDVVFHSDAIKRALDEIRFKKLVCDSAINGINDNLLKEKNEKVSSDYKILTNLKYKGKEISYINIHSLDKSEFANKLEPAKNYKTGVQKEIDQLKNKKIDEIREEDEEKEFDKIDVEKPNEFSETSKAEEAENKVKNQQPKYAIKYTDEIELHNYFYDPNNQGIKPYSKLSIEIQTPHMEGLDKHVIMDISSKLLIFTYKDIYNLNLNLPCEVDVEKCSAKYDKSKRILRVICSIVKKAVEGKFMKDDPNIEEVYEENNKIMEKRGKIEEIKVEKEEKLGKESTQIVENNTTKNKSQDISVTQTENKILELKEDKSHNLIEKKVLEQKEIANEFLEIKQNKEDDKNIKVVEESLKQKEEKAKIEEVNQEKKSEIKQENKENSNPQEKENEKEIDKTVQEKASENKNESIKKETKKEEPSKINFLNFSCSLIYEID